MMSATPVLPSQPTLHGSAIALIDSTLNDTAMLKSSLPASVDTIEYNPATQSARQVLKLTVNAAKKSGTPLDSLLIFSHGTQGEFELGNDVISPQKLQQTAAGWKSLAGLFADHASIDLYGCDTAAGPQGQKLLNDLSQLTRASVFGSTNITGHDGDWTLEAHSSNADLAHAFGTPVDAAALASYPADLLITVSSAPVANPNPVTGTSTSLSAVFVDVGHTPTVTWSIASAPTGGTVTFGSSNGTTTGSNTTATFTKAGSYTLNVTAADGTNPNVASSVTVLVGQTLTSLAITPATATTAVGGTQTFVATGYDQFGNGMAIAPTVLWSSAHGTITLAGVYTAPGSAMADTVTATSGTITANANVTVSNTVPRVATAASANPSTVTGTTAALGVLGAVGAGESNLTYTWAATTKPAGATVSFSANGTNAAKNNTATFSTPGTYVLTATIADGSNTVTSSTSVNVTDSVNAVNLSPGTATVAQNATQTFTAVAYDQFGNPMATQPTFSWSTATGSVGTVSSSGVYTAPVGTGAATVKATASGVSGTAAVTVYNAAPTVATPAAATTVTPADTSVLTVLGADDAGEANLTYNWATTATPAGGTATFSLNNSNLAKTTTATFNKVGTYTMAATITDSGGLSTTSSVNVTVGAVATTLQVLPGTVANLNENGSQTLTTNVLDQFGNTLGVQPNATYAVTSGTGVVTSGGVFTAPSSAGTNVVQVSAGGLTQNVTINVTNAAPTVVTAATANPNPVTGTTTTLTTLGADDGGEANLTYTWSATTKPAGSTVTFSANGTNAAKSSTATFTAAGAYTLQVAISDGTKTTDSTVLVTVAQTLTTLTVTPPTAALHENGTQQFTAAGTDQFGAAMTIPPVVTWSKASGVGSISLTGLYTAPNGVGTATVSATSGTVVGNASIAVTNAAPTMVTAAAATPNPVTGTTAALSVTATDDGGAANLTYTWSALSKPAGSSPTFSANGTNAAAASVVTFNAAGSYTLQVAVSDGTNTTTSNVTVTVAQTMASIAVSAPAGTLGENGHETLTAVADDQFGTPLTTQPVITWNVVGTGASIDAGGQLTAGPLPGTDVVTASSGLVAGTSTVTVQNTAPTVATPAAAGNTIVAGTSTTLSVLGADDGGESNLTYTWAATVKPLGSNPAFTVNGTNAAKNDTVTFNAPGAYTLTATITDGGGLTTTSTTAVTVVQTLAHVSVTPGTAPLNLNGTQQFNAAGTDQFGNAMLVPPTFTWTDTGVGSISATGLYASGTTAGSSTVTATSGGVSGTASVIVTNAAPTIAASAIATPVTGTTSTLAVLGADDGGEANLTYTWSASTKPAGSTVTFNANGTNAAKNTTATFNRAGTYVLTANVSDGTTTTPSSVTVVVGQNVTTINVNPSHGSVNLNGTQPFTAAAFDQFNQPMSTAPTFTWAVSGTAGGSVSNTGLYTASTLSGSATVTAAAAGKTGSATVSVANAAPTVATAAAANASTITGTTTALSVLGADDGGEANLSYTWTATAEPSGATPSFSANGTNGAKATTVTFNEAGTYTFAATITDAGGLTATSSVNVTVTPTLSSVAVSPSASVTPVNGTQQFAAVADDQFGNALTTQPTITWTSTTGGINPAGLYTAPSTIGAGTITATAGAISGTASDVAISNPAVQSTVDPSGTSVHLAVVGLGSPSTPVTWSVVSAPVGAAGETFTVNSSNTAQATTLNLNVAGTYVLQALENGTPITTTVTVNQQLSSISVSPATATLNENGTQQFTASGYDQFGNAMTVPPAATWAVTSGSGSINAAGLYTAPAAPGGAWITASALSSNGSTIAGTASVTVNNAAPTIAVAPLATPNPVLTTSTTLSVLGADDGGESHLTYTWAAVGTNPAPVSFSSNGTNAAKNTTATFTKAGTYSFDVAVSDGTNTTTSSTLSVVVTPVLGTVAISPTGSNLNENATQQFTATANDQFGNILLGQSVTWSLGVGSTGSISNTGLYTAPNGTGTATVIATDGLSSGTASVTVTNAAPVLTTAAAVSPSPATTTTAALSVLATDDGHAAGGGTDLTYTWSALSEPAGATPTFSANGTAAADNTVVTFNKPGNYTFQASISDGTHTITSNVNETVVPTLTTLSINPATATLNENATQTFTATGLDQFGNPLASQPSVVWSSAGVGSINANTGVFSSTGNPGTATVTATVNSLTATATATVVNAAPTVAQAAAANPGTVTGTTTNLTVLGADDGGEANLTYTWAATTAPTGATVAYATNSTNGAKNTTATFNEAGNYVFTVTVSDGTDTVTSSVPVTVEQTATGFTITPSNPTVGENGVVHFGTSQVDQFGNPMSSPAPATWTVTTGTGTIDSNGTFTAPGSPETDTVTATVNGVTQTITFNVTNAPPTITAQASANPANVTGTTSSLSVSAVDDGGASNLTYTWAPTSAPAGATPVFNDNGDNTAANTIVTFNEAGSYTFQVTVSDGTNALTSSVNVTVQQTLTSIGVTPNSAQLTPDASQQFTATGVDQYGNPIAPPPSFTWSSTGTGTVDQTGDYNAGSTPGASLVTVTSGGVTAVAPVTVLYTAPSVATPATATPNPVTGTTTALAVLGADAAGESHLTYTWAATAEPAGAHPSFSVNGTNAAKNDTVTFDAAGEYTFTATISDGTSSTTSSVNVEVDQTATSLALTPPSAIVRPSNTVQFTGTVDDQFADAMATQPTVNYAVSTGAGTVDQTGLYTAPTAQGTAAVTATADGLTATAPISISNSIPSVSVGATANPNPVTGFRTTLSVQGTDTAGEQYLTYTWAMTAGPAGAAPTFSANGTNAAKHSIATFNEAGAYTFTVTLSDGTNTVTSSVNVTVVPTASGITVTPATATLNDGDTQPLDASLVDQFGNAMPVQPAFAWSITAGNGSVNATTGLYTASGPDGYTTVQATAAGLAGTSNITVLGPSPQLTQAAAANPSPVTGKTTNLSVLAADTAGEDNLTYTWAMTAGPTGATPTFSVNGNNAAQDTQATFNMAGNYTFTVTIGDGFQSITSSVDVTVLQTLSSATMNFPTATINTDQQEQLVATGYDQFGTVLAQQPQWSWGLHAGSTGFISATGMFVSSVDGAAQVVAVVSGLAHTTSQITVTAQPPTITTAAYADQPTVTTTTDGLHVVAGEFGLAASQLTYTWSQLSGPQAASFSANGTAAAADTTATFFSAGQYSFQVSVVGPNGLTATSDVSVDVVPTATRLIVMPPNANVVGTGTQQLNAVSLDQFNNLINANTTVAWSLDDGSVGSIDQNGVFSSDGTNGAVTPRATLTLDDGSTVTATGAITVTGNTAALGVTAQSDQPTTGGSVATLTATPSGNASKGGNVTYTWSIVSQPSSATVNSSKGKHTVGAQANANATADASIPQALFGSNNGTTGGANCSVTFLAVGSYTFKVTASSGGLNATDDVTIIVAKAAKNPNLTVMTGFRPILQNGMGAGYTFSFSHPLDPATATNPKAYQMLFETEVPYGRTALQHLLGTHTGSRVVKQELKIGSVSYDASTNSVTVLLAKPEQIRNGMAEIRLIGTGRDALKDTNGNAIDGNDDGKAGGDYHYFAKLETGRKLTIHYADGDIGHLELFGPGKLNALFPDRGTSPYLFAVGTNPQSSVIVGKVTKAKHGSATKTILGVYNSSTVQLALDPSYTVNATL